MRTVLASSLVGLVAARQAGENQNPASPVKKVIQLLQGLKVTVQDDLKKEETQMAEYGQYCDDTQSEKGYAIKTAAKDITRYEVRGRTGYAVQLLRMFACRQQSNFSSEPSNRNRFYVSPAFRYTFHQT